jgi:hypothetical protein
MVDQQKEKSNHYARLLHCQTQLILNMPRLCTYWGSPQVYKAKMKLFEADYKKISGEIREIATCDYWW